MEFIIKILVRILGGVDNLVEEVANSVKIIAEALYDYLNKSTK